MITKKYVYFGGCDTGTSAKVNEDDGINADAQLNDWAF